MSKRPLPFVWTCSPNNLCIVVQICGESECLIVQMLYLDVIPRGLVNFLKDPAIKFPGVGIQGDAVKLKRDWGLECNGTVDLTSLAATILGRPELKFTGLKALAKVVMDYDMAKPKRVTMSNWAKPILDKVQVEYASLDAWVSYAIHQKLFQPTLYDSDS
jgi:ribonuclease D